MTEEERKLMISYLEDMKEEYVEGEGNEKYPLPEWYMLDKVIKIISQQQKIGHWIEHKHGGIEHIECSECGIWFLKADLPRKSYCPNCGSCNGDMIKNIMRDIAKQ